MERYNLDILALQEIVAYAPTNDSNEQDKNDFYEKLQEVTDEIPKHDVAIILGDMNAKVGKETEAFAPSIGKESLHQESNENGIRLASYANQKNLDVRAFRGAESDSDHFLVITKLRTKLKINKNLRAEKKKLYNVEQLKMEQKFTEHQVNIQNRFTATEETEEGDKTNVDNEWRKIEEVVKGATEQIIGFEERQSRNTFFDNECKKIVKERKLAKAIWLMNTTDGQ
ncbi:uncharacterized protein LOC143017487 [Oratosquilla oratoria]|uniref:uncharacterized protein LOC143017487 n=1 Tax=Oratosquilla oratoria TaxID=337810 RepID=UPI003F76087B